MLQFILGTAGSGKTAELLNIIKNELSHGKKPFYIVPEQYSFESEKSMYNNLGARLSGQVTVLSFTSLCYYVFKHLGFPKGQELSKSEKQLAMSLALGEIKDSLKIYNRYSVNTSFITAMVETVEDFKSAGLSENDLSKSSLICEEDALKNKLEDLSLIYTAYESILVKCGADTKDNIKLATQKIRENGLFRDSVVLIDAFMAFTPSEHQLISAIIEQCEKTYMSFCCDGIYDNTEGFGVFSSVKSTIKKLVSNCKSMNIKVLSPILLEENHRFSSEALKQINTLYASGDTDIDYSINSDNIEINALDDPYGEVLYIATEIRELVYSKGYRYKDIAIISRTLDRYNGILERIFYRYSIPYFMDKRTDIHNTPIIMALEGIIEASLYNMETGIMLKLCKSTLFGISRYDCALLENYCFVWNIKGSMWSNEFKNNPRGLAEEFSNKDIEDLVLINNSRKKLVDVVSGFKEKAGEGCAKGFSTAVFDTLKALELEKALELISRSTSEDKRVSFLKEQNLIWEQLISVLDTMVKMLNESSFSFKRLAELFFLCIDCMDFGKLPQTLDQVIIGTADRIRTGEIKATFVLGCIDGEFPAVCKSGGILSDKERNTIGEMGFSITANDEERTSYERYYAYYAITRSCDRLYLSYPKNDMNGHPLMPSSLIESICNILLKPCRTVDLRKNYRLIWNEKTAIDMLCSVMLDSNNLGVEYIAEKLIPNTIAPIKKKSQIDFNHCMEKEELIKSLYGDNQIISPSRIDTFFSCKFQHFLNSTIGIRPLRKVELSPIESGSLIHYVLEMIVKKYGNGIYKEDIKVLSGEIETLVIDYLSQRVKEADMLSPRLKYLFKLMVKDIIVIVEQLSKELEQSLFTPIAFEARINAESSYTPLEVELSNGAKLSITGIVDRIDRYQVDGVDYIRVIDYKSGKKEFKLSDVYFGLNMQMLIYLFAICTEDFIHGDTKPAGILYMPAKNAIISVENSTDIEDIIVLKREKLRMSGLILGQQNIIYGMERGGEGIFIPAKIKDGEIDKKSSIATLAEIGRLYKLVENNLLKMGELLYSGDVSAIPTQGLGYDPCRYCDYKIVCGHSDSDIINSINAVNRAAVLGEVAENE